MTKTAAILFALAAGVAHARNEEFMQDFGGDGLSMRTIQFLMMGIGLLVALRAPFERVSYGPGWRGRALACALALAFTGLAWWAPEPAMILSVLVFAGVMVLVRR